MKVYQTQFKKKNGSLRDITFVKPFSDTTDQAFFTKNVQGVRTSNLQEGSERVWCLDAQGFRVVNFNETTKPVDIIGKAAYNESTNTFDEA